MTNRIILNSFYFGFEGDTDDSYSQCSCSLGNEAIIEEQKSTIGKDVIATNHGSFVRIENVEGGAKFSSVSCIDLEGSIPGMIKGKIATRQGKQGSNTLHFILTGEKAPE